MYTFIKIIIVATCFVLGPILGEFPSPDSHLGWGLYIGLFACWALIEYLIQKDVIPFWKLPKDLQDFSGRIFGYIFCLAVIGFAF